MSQVGGAHTGAPPLLLVVVAPLLLLLLRLLVDDPDEPAVIVEPPVPEAPPAPPSPGPSEGSPPLESAQAAKPLIKAEAITISRRGWCMGLFLGRIAPLSSIFYPGHWRYQERLSLM